MSDSRSALLAAAAEQFAKYGPRGTRVQDIVRAAGVNERMIYHHFGSKDGLYRAVMLDQRYKLGEAWHPVLDKAKAMEPYSGMRLLLGAFFDMLLAHPLAAALFMHEALGDAPTAVPEEVGDFLEPVRSLYERGQGEGVFSDVPFEIAYMTAICTLITMTIFAPRSPADIRTSLDGLRGLRENVVGQVIDGMTG